MAWASVSSAGSHINDWGGEGGVHLTLGPEMVSGMRGFCTRSAESHSAVPRPCAVLSVSALLLFMEIPAELSRAAARCAYCPRAMLLSKAELITTCEHMNTSVCVLSTFYFAGIPTQGAMQG